MKLTVNILIALAFVWETAQGQTTWVFDKNNSSVGFTVRHMMISEVDGRFDSVDISMSSPSEDFASATVEAVIKAASINTANPRRDNHLRSADFFSADSFPTIVFKGEPFQKTGENTFTIPGTLTIKNITKRVAFDAVLGGRIKTSRGDVTGWKATLVINRFDYGLRWDRTIEAGNLVVGEDVTITIKAEFRQTS